MICHFASPGADSTRPTQPRTVSEGEGRKGGREERGEEKGRKRKGRKRKGRVGMKMMGKEETHTRQRGGKNSNSSRVAY